MRRITATAMSMATLIGLANLGLARAEDPARMHEKDRPAAAAHEATGAKVFHCSKADKLIGQAVKDRAGKEIGSVKDLAIDPLSGRIVYGVLSFGGFMGFGEKLFAIPWCALESNTDRTLVLDVTKEQLEASKGFDPDKWPNMADQQWANATYSAFGETPYWMAGSDHRNRAIDNVMPASVVRATAIQGAVLKNAGDEDIGKVNGLVVDCCNGRIAAATVTCNAILGMGGESCMVPWRAFSVTTLDNGALRITSNLTKDQVTTAPKLVDERDYQTRPDYLITVYRHYKVQPYWDADDPIYRCQPRDANRG